jgi:hypothetical protein
MNIFSILQLYLVFFIIYICNLYHPYVGNGSRIKFNNETKLISNKTELTNLLNKHRLLHVNFCDNIKDNLHESICKNNLNRFNKFRNYIEAEKMINILYKSNSNVCNNILEYIDIHKKTINLHSIIHDCNEFQIINNQNKSNLYQIEKYIKICINIFFTLFFILILNINKYSKKNKKEKIKKRIKILNQIKYSNKLDICAICHDSYKPESSNIREINSCKHIYHLECINSWLITYKRNNCPMCNTKCY